MPLPATMPAQVTWLTPSRRDGVYYAGDADGVEPPIFTLNAAGANAYDVADIDGTVVSSGAVSGITVQPATPAGGWKPGHYRLRLYGPIKGDPQAGDSYGATFITIIRPDARFPTRPTAYNFGEGTAGGESQDSILKGYMCVGTTRQQIGAADQITPQLDGVEGITFRASQARDWYASPTYAPFIDTVRPARTLFVQFPNRTWDRVSVGNGRIFVKDGTVDGSQTYITVTAGTTAGTSKIIVTFPDVSTIVETYDNLTSSVDAQNKINTTTPSNYVRFFGTGGAFVNAPATAIGRTYRDGIVRAVSMLYPEGFTHYEGPKNEVDISGDLGDAMAHCMKLFQLWVREGNPNAKTMGPCSCNLPPVTENWWINFIANGGLNYCDVISVHAYAWCTNGNLPQGRYSMQYFKDFLAARGIPSNKPIWITESTHALITTYNSGPTGRGIVHHKRGRVPLIEILLAEQFGIPRENNIIWYDRSHGFWNYTSWLRHIDRSLVPYAALVRVLCEETFGMNHSSIIDFGSTEANNIFLGSVYAAPGGTSTAVMLSCSAIPGATVTISVAGTSGPLVSSDGWGNLTNIPVVGGKATIPISETPRYVRFPVGTSFTSVYSVFNWPTNPPASISPSATVKKLGGATNTAIADTGFCTNFASGTGIALSTLTLPDEAELQWATNQTIQHIVIWCGPYSNSHSGLVDFDIQTLDAITGLWTTTLPNQGRTPPTSFIFGTHANNSGCGRETYDNDQFIHPVSFPVPITCRGIKVYVRATSYGGEPDFAAASENTGQGTATPKLSIQEIAVLPAPAGIFGWHGSGIAN